VSKDVYRAEKGKRIERHLCAAKKNLLAKKRKFKENLLLCSVFNRLLINVL